MNIIEKLGIKPIQTLGSVIGMLGRMALVNLSEVRELEQQRNEMLEALIRITTGDKRNHDLEVRYAKLVIEKAIGKSWEEIKLLMG